jgi:hypothetical protein
MLANILSRLLHDPVSVYLLAGDVIATIAVGFGIIWEHGPPDIRAVANKFVIGGIIVETLCSVLLFSYDANVIGAQNDKIAALEERLASRALSRDQQAEFAKEMPAFGGKTVKLSSYLLDTEAAALAKQIEAALRPWVKLDEYTLMSIVGSGGSIVLGVHVTGTDHALVEQLTSILGATQKVFNTEPFPGGMVGFLGGAIATGNGRPCGTDACIFVGIKPTEQ